MILKYDPTGDAASVLTGPTIVAGGNHHKEQLDADRWVRYDDSTGEVLEYEFLSVRELGVRLDDLVHRDELARLFRDAGFAERDWSHPIPAWTSRTRNRAAG